MELLCPHCQGKLNVADSYAGQLVRCPLCAESFPAPVLPATLSQAAAETLPQAELTPLLPPDLSLRDTEPPVLAVEEVTHPAPPVTPPEAPKWHGIGEGFALAPEPAKATQTVPPAEAKQTSEPVQQLPMATPIATPPPLPTQPVPTAPDQPEPPPSKPAAKGEYRHSSVWYIRWQALAWFAPVGLTLIFFLSFFPWEVHSDFLHLNLWQLAFTRDGYTTFALYMLLFFVAWPFSIAALLLQKKWLPAGPPIKSFIPWLSLALAGPVLLAFFLFLAHYIHLNFNGLVNPSTVWMKVAFRVHFLVVVGALAHFCLERRNVRKLPEPRITVRW